MITSTGHNLTIVILTKPGMDWQTFSTWYSIWKNLPDAQITVACQFSQNITFQLYQWTKRLKIPVFYYTPLDESDYLNHFQALQFAKTEEVITVKALTMFMDVLDDDFLEKMRTTDLLLSNYVCYFRGQDYKELINLTMLESKEWDNCNELCHDASHEEIKCLVSCEKGIGKWLNTSEECPFSNAAGFATMEMSVNERKVIELWKKMVPLYNVMR